MPLILGLDTGGTFTDAALLDAENRQVVAHAKSLTTRHDLSVGVGAAMAEALAVFGEIALIFVWSACRPPWPQMRLWKVLAGQAVLS